ncbi:MAG: type IV toxin-antitoxin system AbiEi family antitoxin domain-containing protein [Nitriliruptorales bacterium]
MSSPSLLVPVPHDDSLSPYEAAAEVARGQFGFITFNQLLDCGWSRAGMNRALERNRLIRVHEDVYEFPGAPLTWGRALVAAMLAVGPPVAAARSTSLAGHGMRRFQRAGRTHLLVPYGRSARPTVDGVTVHRSRTLVPEDVEVVHGILTSHPLPEA